MRENDAREESENRRLDARKSRFLVPVDFSSDSVQVLAYAVRLAQVVDGSVTALAVVDLNFQPLPNVPASCPGLQEDLASEARAKLQQLVDGCPRTVEIDTAVRVGVPWESICQFANEGDCSLILMAKHQHRWWERPFTRHTVDKVFENAGCVVQVIEVSEDGEPLSIPDDWLLCGNPPQATAATHT